MILEQPNNQITNGKPISASSTYETYFQQDNGKKLKGCLTGTTSGMQISGYTVDHILGVIIADGKKYNCIDNSMLNASLTFSQKGELTFQSPEGIIFTAGVENLLDSTNFLVLIFFQFGGRGFLLFADTKLSITYALSKGFNSTDQLQNSFELIARLYFGEAIGER